MIRALALRLFDRLPFSLRYELFYQASRSLGVESYGVSGAAGAFCGPTWDTTLMKAYLQGIVWPAREIAALKAFFNGRPGTLYDIGANIGLVTVPLARAGVNVVAFEPDEMNCSMLRANVARACLETVRIFQAAVYREAATLRFARSRHNSGDHRLSEMGEIEVKAIALDSFMPLPDGPLALKIDTQGAEPGVFEGGQRTIAAADMLLSEFWPFGIARMGNKPDVIIETVRSFPHGRLIDKRESEWMSGTELADRLQAACRDLDENNDMDFIVAKEPISI